MLDLRRISRTVLIVCAMSLFLMGSGDLFAQDINITGKITDKLGDPVAGAYVIVGVKRIGASSGIDGTYSIIAPSTAKLVFTSMGYKDVVESVGGRSVINIVMEEDALVLEDVVVTALGVKKERKALGYSVTEINSAEMFKNKQANVINSLAGKVPGVIVTQSSGAAGAGSSIIIRGGNSASETRDNQPLFVVDGIIYDNNSVNGGSQYTDGITNSTTTFSNRAMDINPEDIESVSILKGAAAAALYGSRAADGVIIITTKKGSHDGFVKINLSSKYNYSTISSVPEIQSVYGRGSYDINGSLQTEQITSSWGAPNTGNVYNNAKDFFQSGNIWDNSISISGGHKNGNYYLSLSRYDQEGVVPGTNYDRTTARLNCEQKYDILTVEANVAYSIANTQKTLTSSGLKNSGGNGTMTAIYGWSRSEDMSHWLNADGTKYRMFPNQDLKDDVENPYWIINRDSLSDKNERITAAVNTNLKITQWLSANYRIGIDSYTNDAYTYIAPDSAVREIEQNGRLSKSKVNHNYLNSNFMINAQKTWGDFDFDALAGTTAETTDINSQTQWGWDFVTKGTISFNNILNNNKFFNESKSLRRLVAVYGEIRASWKNMLYLTVTGRNDWSSTLPANNNSYFYPSVSSSFVFTELIPKNDVLTFGKIRGSFAQVGKDASPYSTNTYLWPAEVVSSGITGTGNYWTGGSPYLVPEIQTSWEFGTELKFFKGRFGIDFTYYNSILRNQIASPRLGQSTGYIFLTINSGSVQNKGMELMLTGTPVDTKDLTWDLTLNLAGNRGTLGDFVEGVDFFYVSAIQIGGVKAASIPNGGYFLGLTGNYWLREMVEVDDLDADGNVVKKKVESKDGRYQVDSATGLYKLKGSETNVVGNREPDFTGGLSSTLRWRDLSLSFLFDFRMGGDIYNGTQYYLTTLGQSMRTLNRDKVTVDGVDSITGDAVSYVYEKGQTYEINGIKCSGEYMIQQYWLNYCNNAYNFIQKVNWLRLRSLSLSYDFSDMISKRTLIKGLIATFSANNIFCLTNYIGGMDPEVAAVGSGVGGSGSVGIDYCGVPSQRVFSFGLNLSF